MAGFKEYKGAYELLKRDRRVKCYRKEIKRAQSLTAVETLPEK